MRALERRFAAPLGLLLLTFLMGTVSCKQASKKRWIAEMSRKLPGELCKDDTYFRECFQVTRSECVRVAQQTTDKCLEQYRSQLPRVLKQPRDGRHSPSPGRKSSRISSR